MLIESSNTNWQPVTVLEAIISANPDDRLVQELRQISLDAVAADSITSFLPKHIPELFKLRMQLFSWVLKKRDGTNIIMEAEKKLKEEIVILRAKEPDKNRLKLLEDFESSCHFSLRIASSVVPSLPATPKDLDWLEHISFHQYMDFIHLSFLPHHIKQAFTSLVESSLKLEFTHLIIFLVLFENIQIDNAKVNQLSSLLEQSQESYLGLLYNLWMGERMESALLSEAALAKDWLRAEEDEAWQNL